MDPIEIGLTIAHIGVDLLKGKRNDEAQATTEIAGHALKLIPVETLRAHLAEEDRKAIDLAADIAQEAKLAKENES